MEPPPKPKFSPEDWADLERILGCSVNDKARADIENVVDTYVIARHFARIDVKRKRQKGREHEGKVKVSTPILSLIRTMERLMEKWQALKPAERRSLQEYSDDARGRSPRLPAPCAESSRV